MDPRVKSVFQSLINAILFLLLCVILLPPLMRALGEPAGKALYGALVAACVGVALRLRHLSAKL